MRLSVDVSSTVVFKDETVEYHWTFSGTNAGPGGTGVSVRIFGFEEWTFGDDGLAAGSQGHYDQAEYDRPARARGAASADNGWSLLRRVERHP